MQQRDVRPDEDLAVEVKTSLDSMLLFVCKEKARYNKKHLKNVGPIRYCKPPLHCQSPDVASRTPATAIAQAACDVHDNNNNNNDDDDNV